MGRNSCLAGLEYWPLLERRSAERPYPNGTIHKIRTCPSLMVSIRLRYRELGSACPMGATLIIVASWRNTANDKPTRKKHSTNSIQNAAGC